MEKIKKCLLILLFSVLLNIVGELFLISPDYWNISPNLCCWLFFSVALATGTICCALCFRHSFLRMLSGALFFFFVCICVDFLLAATQLYKIIDLIIIRESIAVTQFGLAAGEMLKCSIEFSAIILSSCVFGGIEKLRSISRTRSGRLYDTRGRSQCH